MKNTKRTLGIIVVFLFAMSCERSTVVNKTDSTSNPVTTGTTGTGTTGTGTGTGSSDSCSYGSADALGISDSGQSIEYYKLNNPPVIAHGENGGTVVWSSDTDLPSVYNQNIFFSDSRFNLRVIPRYQNKGVDSRGRTCAYVPQPFTKMNIGIVLRPANNPPGVGDYYQFKDVDVNCPSKVRTFQVPTSPDPLVVDVMNVEWDWSCQSYMNSNGGVSVPGYCPYDNVWLTECYQLEIQFSTDTTKDLPGTRAY